MPLNSCRIVYTLMIQEGSALIKQKNIFILAFIIFILAAAPTVILLAQVRLFQSESIRQVKAEILGTEYILKYDESQILNSQYKLHKWVVFNDETSDQQEIILDPTAESYYLGQLVTYHIPFIVQKIYMYHLTPPFNKSEEDWIYFNREMKEHLEKISVRILRVEIEVAASRFTLNKRYNTQDWDPILHKIEKLIVKNADNKELVRSTLSELLNYRNKQIGVLHKILSERLIYFERGLQKYLWLLFISFVVSLSLGFSLFIKLLGRIEKSTLEILEKDVALEKSSKLSLLGELTSSIGHEIANPLNILTTSIEQINKKNQNHAGVTKEDIQKHYEKSTRAINRVTSIIKSIRSMIAEDHVKNIQKFTIQDTITEVTILLEHLLEKNSVQLIINQQSNLPLVIGLPIETGQILSNLIKNAVEILKLQDSRIIQVHFNEIAHQNKLEIYVVDSGPGIPRDLVDKIFQPMFSTKVHEGGTGIGLSYSRKVAEKMNATLELVDHSFELSGACFKLTMPTSQA